MHATWAQLEAGLTEILRSPAGDGVLQLLVRRPEHGVREVLAAGTLDERTGLMGDNWSTRGSKRTDDGSAHPDMQLNVMNARVIDLVARTRERWPLAGDQLYLDLDLSVANLPPGSRIALGSAIIEVTAQPHNGCKKFAERFGMDALKWVNTPAGKQQRLRGLNARVAVPGGIRTGDVAHKI